MWICIFCFFSYFRMFLFQFCIFLFLQICTVLLVFFSPLTIYLSLVSVLVLTFFFHSHFFPTFLLSHFFHIFFIHIFFTFFWHFLQIFRPLDRCPNIPPSILGFDVPPEGTLDRSNSKFDMWQILAPGDGIWSLDFLSKKHSLLKKICHPRPHTPESFQAHPLGTPSGLPLRRRGTRPPPAVHLSRIRTGPPMRCESRPLGSGSQSKPHLAPGVCLRNIFRGDAPVVLQTGFNPCNHNI